MAVLYITEHRYLSLEAGCPIPVASMPPLAEQTVNITGTTAPSAAFNAETRYIGVHVDAICSIEFGAAPTATTANRRFAADSTEYFAVGQGQKLAVIENT